MPILVNLDVMMSKRRVGVSELAGKIGISLPNLSILKNNKARAIRFSTLDAICRELEQQPGIFCIHAEAVEGELKPGDDVLFLVVAGDIREHVKATFSELLDRIKAEAVIKQEFTE